MHVADLQPGQMAGRASSDLPDRAGTDWRRPCPHLRRLNCEIVEDVVQITTGIDYFKQVTAEAALDLDTTHRAA